MMNVIIAFVSDTYNRVNQNKETASYREMAELILDLELLSRGSIDLNQRKFLSFARENEIEENNKVS
jgi:hypothetical protein